MDVRKAVAEQIGHLVLSNIEANAQIEKLMSENQALKSDIAALQAKHEDPAKPEDER